MSGLDGKNSMGKKVEVHLIEKRITGRKYASPGRARAAIGRSNLPKAEAKRLLALVDVWEKKPLSEDWSETPGDVSARRKPRITPPSITPPSIAVLQGAAPAGAPLLLPSGSPTESRVRLATVFRAYRLLAELAHAEGAPLLDLLGDVQAYEISIRSEVSRRESHRENHRESHSPVEEVGFVAAGPDP